MNFITKAPVMLCGGDYNPDQWLDRPDILEADIRMMKKAGMNSVTLGVFAWAAYEPREGEYNFTWLREIMDRLYDQGIYTELATPTGAKPNWLARKYPEVLRVQSNGVRDHQGMRHNHCLTSPIYRQKVEELLNHLIDAVGDHPGLILWHISNELGGECYCPLCQERFRGWLKEKYHTIDALNHAWWTSFWSHHYDSFDEVEPPFDNGEQSLNGLKLDWRRFTTWNMMDYVHSETAILRKRTPNVPITTNLMEYFPGLDYHKLQRELDFVCWDSYPHWGRPDRSTTVTAGMTAFDHALIRGCKPDKPFLLMESTPSLVNWHEYNKLKRPGVNRMSAIQTVACGADGVQYFQWRKGRGGSEQFHGAVVDHDGRDDTRVFNEVTATNEALAALTPVCGSLPKADAAMIFDWDNRWALDDAQGPRNLGMEYEKTVNEHYRPFWEQGIAVDVIDADVDLTPYQLVIAPMLYMVRDGFAGRAEAFVANGGHLVTTYWTGIVNESDLCYLGGFPGPLRNLLGIWAEEIDCLNDGEFNLVQGLAGNQCGLQGPYQVRHLCELIHIESAQALATYRDDFYAGRPAVTVNAFGKGKAWHVASRNDLAFQRDFFTALSKELALPRAIATELPPGVVATARTDGDNAFIFLQNYSAQNHTLTLPQGYWDCLTDAAVSAPLTLSAWDCRILRRHA